MLANRPKELLKALNIFTARSPTPDLGGAANPDIATTTTGSRLQSRSVSLYIEIVENVTLLSKAALNRAMAHLLSVTLRLRYEIFPISFTSSSPSSIGEF